MPRETFWSVFEIQPFRPVTVHTTSRSSYVVTRRESIWPASGGDTVVIATGDERFVMIAMDQITSLQMGPPRASLR